MKITGTAGDWTIQTDASYSGWVRVVAPIGTSARSANSAAALGKLVSAVASDADRWGAAAPKLKGLTVTESATSVTATWTFDKAGAVVPVAAVMASLGGYSPQIETGTVRLDAPNECGPLTISTDPQLRIRFLVRRLPSGRSLASGEPVGELPGTTSSLDIGAVAELALANLVGSRDKLARSSAEEVLSTFLTEANYVLEPFTGQRLPYAADGHGADLAAAHALLMQSLCSTVSATSEPNSLLTSLTWRRDAYTWLFWSDDAMAVRRTGALAALAGALCAEPQRRLEAALFEAGLAAQRGLVVWRRRRGEIPKEPALIEPLEAVRSAFFIERPGKPVDPFVSSLFSELRVYGDEAITLQPENGALRVRWNAPDTRPMILTFASAYPLEIIASGPFEKFTVEGALGFTIVHCSAKDAGPCYATVKIPSWASPCPPAAAAPRYSETAH